MFVLWCVLMWMKFNFFFFLSLSYVITHVHDEKLLWLFTNEIYRQFLFSPSFIVVRCCLLHTANILQMKLRCVCLCVRSSILKITVENEVFNVALRVRVFLKHFKYVNKNDSWKIAVNLKGKKTKYSKHQIQTNIDSKLWRCQTFFSFTFMIFIYQMEWTMSCSLFSFKLDRKKWAASKKNTSKNRKR